MSRSIRSREQIRKRAFGGGETVDDALKDKRSLRHQRLAGTKKLLSLVGSNFVPGDKNSVSAIRKSLNAAASSIPPR